jgi:hypothetical protein
MMLACTLWGAAASAELRIFGVEIRNDASTPVPVAVEGGEVVIEPGSGSIPVSLQESAVEVPVTVMDPVVLQQGPNEERVRYNLFATKLFDEDFSFLETDRVEVPEGKVLLVDSVSVWSRGDNDKPVNVFFNTTEPDPPPFFTTASYWIPVERFTTALGSRWRGTSMPMTVFVKGPAEIFGTLNVDIDNGTREDLRMYVFGRLIDDAS